MQLKIIDKAENDLSLIKYKLKKIKEEFLTWRNNLHMII